MPDLKQRLEFEKSALEQSGQKFKVKKMARLIYPSAFEIQYRRRLRNIANDLTSMIKQNLFPALEGLVEEANFERRVDQYTDRLQEIVDTVKDEYDEKYPEEEIRFLASDQANKISNSNRNQLTRILSNSLGVDIFFNEPWLAEEAKAFVNQNVSLITSIRNEHLKDVEALVNNAIQSGKTTRSIINEIKERYREDLEKKPRNRAELIARDQTGKFHGNVNQLRQRELGIESYIWRTAKDDRVRPTHRTKEGEEFEWNEPPADTGHPGQDYQCRCIAEPVLDDILPPEVEAPPVEEVKKEPEPAITQKEVAQKIADPPPNTKVGTLEKMMPDQTYKTPDKLGVNNLPLPPDKNPLPNVMERKVSLAEEPVTLENFKKFGITDDEIEAIKNYTKDEYVFINSWLRKGNDAFYKKDLKEMVPRSKGGAEKISSFMKKAPKVKKTVYRGMNTHFTEAQNWAKMNPGDIIEDKAFVSTSKDFGIAKTFSRQGRGKWGVDFVVENATGVDLSGVSLVESNMLEGEVLLNTGTKFRIKNVKQYSKRGAFDYNPFGSARDFVEITMEVI